MTQSITITMPTELDIIARLKSVENEGGDVARFYRKFAAATGNKPINQMGVMLRWNMELHTIANEPGATPFISGMINLNYDEYMTALFPDNPEFAAACIAWANNITSQMGQGE